MATPNPFGKHLEQAPEAQEQEQERENPFGRDLENRNPFGQQLQAPELDRFGQPVGQQIDTSVPPPSYESDQGRLSSAGGAFMRGFGSIVASLPKAIGEGAVILANKFGDDPIWGNPDKLAPEDTTSYQIGESIEKWFNKFAVNPKYQDEFLASALPQGAGSMAGFLAGGFAARAGGLPGWLAAGGLGASATGVEQVDDYLRELSEDEKADPEMRENAFLLGSALGTSEALPIQQMLNRIDKFTGGSVTQILKEGFKGGLEELTQEVLQSVGQNLIASDVLKYDPDRGMFTGTQEAGDVGFTVGFALNTLAALIGARRAGRMREPGDETGDGKIELPDIEVEPMEAQDILGAEQLPEREDEIVQQRTDDVPPPEAFEDGGQDQAGVVPGVGGAEIDPAKIAADVPPTPEQPTINYFDNRLKRDIYRGRLKHLVDEELVPGGGVSLVPDHTFVGGESDTRDDQGRPQAPLVRTPSLNPEWYQRLMEDSNYKMSVDNVRKASDKAIAGERLGVRQARVISAILDQITAERMDQLDYARKQLQVARDARAAAGLQPADDWLFEEDEYPDDFDGLSRTFAELLDQAQTLDEGLADQVEALMESQADDAQVLAAITKLIGEFNGRKSQENAAALAQTQGQAEIPSPGTQPIPGEPAVPAPGAEQPAAGRRPAESLPAEQEVAPAAPAKAMEQFQTGDRVRITAEGFNNIEGTLTEEALNGFMVQYTDPELGFTEEQFIELEDLEIVEKQLPQERVAAAEKAYKEQDRRKKKQPGRKKERRQPKAEERRQAWLHRKQIDEMSPEERKAAIEQLRGEAKKHPKTGIGSSMAWDQVEKKAYIAAIDADDLKYVNDALGESAGDQLLQKIADALKAEFGEDAFHTGGDEFKTHGDEYGPLASKLVNAQKALEDATVEGPGGSMTGIGFSWGIGYDVDEADRKMKQDKKDRTEAGKRAKRGEAPEGVTLKEKPEEEADPNVEWALAQGEGLDPNGVTVLIKGNSLFASWTFKVDVPPEIDLDQLEDKGWFNSWFRGDRSYTFQQFWTDPQQPTTKLRIVNHEDGTATITYTEDWSEDAKANWPKYKQAAKGAPEHLNVDQRDGNIEAEENITEELKEQGNAIGRQLEMDADNFREIMQEYGTLFVEPDKKLNYNASLTVKGPYIPQGQAADLLATWKENARQQGTSAQNANRIVLSFFDLTGEWSKPWVEAGYDVYQFDLQNMDDIMDWSVEYMNELFGGFDNVYAILAAPPCTDYTSAVNRYWWKKNLKGHTEASNELVHQVMRTVNYLKPSIWALENPVGRISSMTGLPNWRLLFDPSNFGQPYTKKTAIYGRFDAENMPLANVDPVEGSKMASKWGGSSQATKNARAETPEGFSYSFFMANNAVDNPVTAITGKYDELDANLLRQAIEAGITEEQIDTAVEDLYWQELRYDSANQAVADMIAKKGKTAKVKKKKHPGKKKAEPQPVEVTPEEEFDLTAQTEADLDERERAEAEAEAAAAVPPPEAFELEGDVTPIEQSAAQPDMFSAIDEQAHEAAASPTNDKSPPSKKQIEANNYAKGHPDKAKTQGFEIVIENPEGTRRRPEWPPMAAHYGDLVGTLGADGDPIDVFLKPGLDEIPAGTPIFVIDQKVNGKFDEHKVFFGFDSMVEANNAYTASYTKGFDGILENTKTTPEELQAWIDDLKANEGQRALSFGDWTRSQPGYVLAVKPIHWLMQHAERVTTFEGNQQIDTWKFNGRLPKNMVNELKQIAKDIPGFNRSSGAKTEKYSFTLENTEQVSDSIVFGFGTTKSTANSIKFQRMRYTEGAAETTEVQPTDYANFAGRVVTWEQQDESGLDIIIEVDADEIMRDYDQRIATLEQLVKDCG